MVKLKLYYTLFYFRYYKKFKIPDMDRCNLRLEQEHISIAHANNTLMLSVSTRLLFYKSAFLKLDSPANLYETFSKLSGAIIT